MPQKTPTSRRMCSEIVAVTPCRGDMPKLVLTGNLEEIGERSAVILTDSPIRRGIRITVRCSAHQLRGLVRSCRFDKWLGFLVEVRLDKVSRWSTGWFTPQHFVGGLEETGD